MGLEVVRQRLERSRRGRSYERGGQGGRRVDKDGLPMCGNDQSTGSDASAQRSPSRKDDEHTPKTSSSAGSASILNLPCFVAGRHLLQHTLEVTCTRPQPSEAAIDPPLNAEAI
jgi:hypothetical protein